VKLWDASAIVPLLVMEPTTAPLQALAAKDPALLVWWATHVECASALARLARDGALDPDAVEQAFERLRQLAAAWHQVDAGDGVREAAVRSIAA
jgi:uncharacterized protein with PIN domain